MLEISCSHSNREKYRNMESAPHILVVDDEAMMRSMMVECLAGSGGYTVSSAENAADARSVIDNTWVDILITDIAMPGESGLELSRWFTSRFPDSLVIVVTAFPDPKRVQETEKIDVFAFLIKPFSIKQLRYTVMAAVERLRLLRENKNISDEHQPSDELGLIGVSEYVRSLRRQVLLMAGGSFPVLITGESGTGKEVIAHAIHANSVRRGSNMITINCAAIPKQLEESEFFGHAKGAFTGAFEHKDGFVGSANESTLFLDEIGELSSEVQAKLLRVLDTGEFTRVGEVKPHKVDIRILSATNRNLEEAVAAGAFRKDLYFRIKAAAITTKPLSTHPEDIPYLARHFLKTYGPGKLITSDAMEILCAYPWPGNIRELKHAIHMVCSASKEQKRIGAEAVRTVLSIDEKPRKEKTFHDARMEFEHSYFTTLLRKHEGNVSRVAAEAGLHRPNLLRKLKAVSYTHLTLPTIYSV